MQLRMRHKLKKDLRRSVRSGHPWLYEDAFERLDAAVGSVVDVIDKDGKWAGRGIRDVGPIGVRIFTLDPKDALDQAFFSARIGRAVALRDKIFSHHRETSAYRLVHGEGDGLPGIVCDRYGEYAVVRLDGDYLDGWTDTLREAFVSVLAPLGIEHILLRQGRRERKRTTSWRGHVPQAPVRCTEHGMTLLVDLVEGQKTGAFVDHREGRRLVRSLATQSRALNLYGYSGGFSIAAGLGGAREVHTVDIAPGALALAHAAWSENNLDPETHECFCQDVFTFLDNARERAERYDLVVSDPPNFAPNQAAREKALASYEKLHRKVFELVEHGGLYFAGSCSSHVEMDAFLLTLREAARKNKTALQLLDVRHAPPDHPRLPAFPEGDYLKAVLCRVLG